jgi:formylglycine-generating enzyme required for sulfatase activity
VAAEKIGGGVKNCGAAGVQGRMKTNIAELAAALRALSPSDRDAVMRATYAPPTVAKKARARLAGKAVQHALPDGSFIELVAIPAGTFTRGCDTSHWSNERPEARITMSAYLIARYPTTVGQFRAFVAATSHVTTAETERSTQTWRAPGFAQTDDHPVVCVSHHDATAFCAWAGLALPTEAQWEYAARGTDGRTYPWGEDAPDDTRLWWSGTTRRNGTCPVGEHPAGVSPFGVHDLAGNAWEWTADWYDSRGYDPAQTTDPAGAKQGSCRALRGGCWSISSAGYVRAAYRYWVDPAYWDDDGGFRASRGAK